MKFLKLPKELFDKFWLKIDPKDRRLIKLYLIISNSVLLLCLVLLFFIAPESPIPVDDENGETQTNTSSSSTTTDSSMANTDDSTMADSLSPMLNDDIPVLKEVDTKAHEIVVDFHLRDLKYKDALPHLLRLYENEEDPDLLYQIGETFLNAGQPDSALGRLERVKRLFPNSMKSPLPLIQAKFQTGKVDESLKDIKEWVKAEPTADNISLLAGMESEAYPHHNTAKERFARAHQMDSNSILLQRERGLWEYRQGNFRSALQNAHKFSQLDPLNFRAYAQKGAALFQLNKIDKAEAEFRAALALAPEDYTSWYNLGEVYYRRSYLSESAEDIRQKNIKSLEYYIESLKHQPDHPRAHYRVGVLMLNNKQFKESILHFKKTLKEQPKHVMANLHSAIAYKALGMVKEAKKSIAIAYALEPLNRMVSSQYKEIQKLNK